MISKQKQKRIQRYRRHRRVRAKVFGTADVPRIAVFRSNKHIYGQAIDDQNGHTLFSQIGKDISVKDLKSLKSDLKNKEKIAFIAGKMLAEKMKNKKIKKAVFDRGGFKYHGRTKAFAQGVREGGVKL